MNKLNYEQALTESLKRADMNGVQIQAVLTKYKIQAAKTNEVQAFLEMVSSFANESEHVLLAGLIENALKKANSEVKIDVNPVTRTKSYVERHNKWLEHADKLGIENGTPLDAEKLKMKLPSYIKTEASYKNKKIPVELEVRK